MVDARRGVSVVRACTAPQSLGFVTGVLPELVSRYRIVLLASPGKQWDMVDKYADRVTCAQIPMERHISLLRDLKSLWRIYRLFRREKPTMVHSMTPKAGMLCMMAAWAARVPLRIHTFTGLVFPTSTGLKRRILMLTDWITCACASHIIPEGEGVKRDLLSHNITRKDIHVLGYGNCRGIDLERFARTEEVMARAAEIRKPGVFTFIAIGRLIGDKGINELVEAFRRLQEERGDSVRLLLVGYYEKTLDPVSPATEREIDTNPGIEAVGLQHDVRPWLAASDCHVLASYREGFPNVVIEAGAMGLPQIVTDINGSNEIIVEGRNGTIVPSKSAEALLVAMRRMLDEPEWRTAMAQNARPMVADRYEQGFVRQCLFAFYDSLLSQPAAH